MTITVRSASGYTEQERLECALRSTDEHLIPEGARVLVCGPDKHGNLVELGSVDPTAALQVGAPHLRALIDRVRFGPHMGRNRA